MSERIPVNDDEPRRGENHERLQIALVRMDRAEEEVNRIVNEGRELNHAEAEIEQRRAEQIDEIMDALEDAQHNEEIREAVQAEVKNLLDKMERIDDLKANQIRVNDEAILSQAAYAYEQEKIIAQIEREWGIGQTEIEE